MDKKFYVAACAFTEDYPTLSRKIQHYLTEKFNLPIIRCCVPNFRVADCDGRVPAWYRDEWSKVKHFEKFPAGSTMISICHNCSAIAEESRPEIFRQSIWEFILEDKTFKFPNHNGEKITLQDCWRAKGNHAEQLAVREILRRMNFEIIELEENFDKSNFCGYSLYQPQAARNAKLAPKRFVENAVGFFQEHTQEEKENLMREHCAKITTEKVVAYCHYCARGLKLGGKTTLHLVELLFNKV